MSRIDIHPACRELLAQHGLTTAEDFLRLQGEILGGHPDRHVLRLALGGVRAGRSAPSAQPAVAVGAGGDPGYSASATAEQPVLSAPGAECSVRGGALGVYLKKEHRISWRDRLAHAWLGCGWVSKSTREGRMLRQVEQAGIGCPRALAWGEADGRAFLLVREEPGVADLREYLRNHPGERPAIAQSLAEAVARIHEAGFFHRDLSSKHVLIRRDDGGYRFCFLDWQRSRRLGRVTWRHRLLDLAMLDATVAADGASPRERLLFWNAYVAAVDGLNARPSNRSVSSSTTRPDAAARARPQRLLHVLCRLSARLQRKRRIRELRQAPLPAGKQNLIWLDGEALCVTRQFLGEVGTPPTWLQSAGLSRARNALEATTIASPDGRAWRLVRRWSHRPLHWLAHLFQRAPFPAPEFEQAAAIIRLERYGVEAPRLLALGHRSRRPWQQESFLLVEPPHGTTPLLAAIDAADVGKRRRWLRQAGALWRRVHEAGYAWRGRTLAPLAVSTVNDHLVLADVDWLQRRPGTPDQLAAHDLLRLLDMPLPDVSATDRLRFALGYFGQQRATGETGKLLRRLVKRSHRAQRRRAWLERRVS